MFQTVFNLAWKNARLRSQSHAQAGFTLLELLMVLAIIGILASISVGRFNQHLVQSNRRAAVASLYAGQQMMERARLQNGQYVNLNNNQIAVLQSQGQNYVIAGVANNNGLGYQLTATPPLNRPDANCGTLTITETDLKTESGTSNVDDCWQ